MPSHSSKGPCRAINKRLTRRAFAALVGLSKGRIDQYVGEGMPTPGGKIDAVKARAWIAAHYPGSKVARAVKAPAPLAGGAAAGPADLGEMNKDATHAEARRVHEILKAEERRLTVGKLRAQLVERRIMEQVVGDVARAEREAWMQWPGRVAATMAAGLGCDGGMLQRALESAVRQQLGDVADAVDEVRRRDGPSRRAS